MTKDIMTRDIRSIPLDMIKLDQENVRFGNDVAQNQREAIDLMMADPDDAKKLLRLAEHIAEHGLDPTELQLVTQDSDGSFIVLEGNRRLTALKLLQKPDLCPAEKVFKGFLTAHTRLGSGVPQTLQCSVVASRADGDMWIELKHTGQNNGIGRVNWDSNIRDERRARQTGIDSIGRQIRNLVKDNPTYFSEKALEDAYKIPVTTLTRLFSSLPGQKTFHLKIENKELIPNFSLKHIAPSLEFALNMFVDQGYNVNDIRNDEDRIKFVSHIPPELNPTKLAHKVITPPVEGKVNVAPTPPMEAGGDGEVHGPTGDGKASTTGPSDDGQSSTAPLEAPFEDSQSELKRSVRAKPLSRARKYLIPWPLNISNSRINAIYRDLRKTLVVDECPNAVAVTFRVFVEVSCDDYIHRAERHSDPVLRSDNNKPVRDGINGDKLSTKVQSIAKHLESRGELATASFKAVSKRATSFDSVGSVDHFNLFVHSSASAPIPSELKDIADEYKPLLESIWK